MTLKAVKLTKSGKRQEVEQATLESMEEYQVELQQKTEKLQLFLKENKISLFVSGEFINNEIVSRIGIKLLD